MKRVHRPGGGERLKAPDFVEPLARDDFVGMGDDSPYS